VRLRLPGDPNADREHFVARVTAEPRARAHGGHVCTDPQSEPCILFPCELVVRSMDSTYRWYSQCGEANR
jgi:hypothetical protein